MSATVVLLIGAALIVAAIALAIPTIIRQTRPGSHNSQAGTSTTARIPMLAWVLLIAGFVIEIVGFVMLMA